MNKRCLTDTTGHDLLDINITHPFTPDFNLYSVLLATKTDFLPPHKKDTTKIRINYLRACTLLLTTKSCFRNDTFKFHKIKLGCSIAP